MHIYIDLCRIRPENWTISVLWCSHVNLDSDVISLRRNLMRTEVSLYRSLLQNIVSFIGLFCMRDL